MDKQAYESDKHALNYKNVITPATTSDGFYDGLEEVAGEGCSLS